MVNLKMPPEQAVLLLQSKVDEITTMRKNNVSYEYYDLLGWCSTIWTMIDSIYAAGEIHPDEIRSIGVPACSCSPAERTQMLLDVYYSRLLDYIEEIRGLAKSPE